MSKDDVRIPFDPDTESMYCARDGIKLEKSSHMSFEGMMCPRHGEFTIAPVIMRQPERIIGGPPKFDIVPNPSPDAGKWFIHTDPTTASMWETCKHVDARHEDGSDYRPGETRVL